jgi:hypothetical protein
VFGISHAGNLVVCFLLCKWEVDIVGSFLTLLYGDTLLARSISEEARE